ncbi:MAG: cytochrome c-type biogenesis protein [Paracoccaceae bacterium]|jgi:cytochrome c-type biogenesis protein
MGFDVGLWGAALAGLLSFLSPCILPIVPFYLCYLAGLSFGELTGDEGAPPNAAVRRKAVLSSIFFAAGVTTIFVGLGWTASTFGQQLREWMVVIRYGASAIIIVLGLHFIGVFRIGFLMREARIDAGERRWGLAGAYVIGMAFAFGWTPCVGPVLTAILFTAAGSETANQGALLLLAYALGMTLPFVVAAAFIGPFLSWAKGFRKYLPMVEKVMGGFLIIFGLLIAFDAMRFISEFMLSIAPDIGTLQ